MTTTIDQTVLFTTIHSPIGELILSGTRQSISGLYLCKQKHAPKHVSDWVRDDQAFSDAARQLKEYFQGTRQEFDLVLEPQGTDFQKRVWQGLCQIPYGKTCGYGELAKALCNPNASRAVGMANGRNPISIIVPCHRVIGADGSLTGYGGGLAAKKWLLEHEAKYCSHQGDRRA